MSTTTTSVVHFQQDDDACMYTLLCIFFTHPTSHTHTDTHTLSLSLLRQISYLITLLCVSPAYNEVFQRTHMIEDLEYCVSAYLPFINTSVVSLLFVSQCSRHVEPPPPPPPLHASDLKQSLDSTRIHEIARACNVCILAGRRCAWLLEREVRYRGRRQ